MTQTETTDAVTCHATRRIEAVEIHVRWGDCSLLATRLFPVRPFSIGERDADFIVPVTTLGCKRAELLQVDTDGRCFVVVGADADASLEHADGETTPVPPGDATNRLELVRGSSVTVCYGDLSFTVSAEQPEKRMLGRWRPGRTLAAVGASAVATLGFIAAAAAGTPPPTTTDDGMPTQEQSYLMKEYLTAIAKTADEPELPEAPTTAEPGSGTSVDGSAGGDDADRPQAVRGPGNDYYRGPNRAPAPISNDELKKEAGIFGVTQFIDTIPEGDPNSPWAAADPTGLTGNQSMWTDVPGAPLGPLSLTNPGGEGSTTGGDWYTMPFPNTSPWQGFDPVRSPLIATRDPRAPRVQTPKMKQSGAIPAAVIQRIVRANYGRFRGCYQTGLRTNPSLQGRVAVRFVIGRDGRVMSAADGGSDLADRGVVNCVVGAMNSLTFPAPDSGIVTVSYPIILMPPTS